METGEKEEDGPDLRLYPTEVDALRDRDSDLLSPPDEKELQRDEATLIREGDAVKRGASPNIFR